MKLPLPKVNKTVLVSAYYDDLSSYSFFGLPAYADIEDLLSGEEAIDSFMYSDTEEVTAFNALLKLTSVEDLHNLNPNVEIEQAVYSIPELHAHAEIFKQLFWKEYLILVDVDTGKEYHNEEALELIIKGPDYAIK